MTEPQPPRPSAPRDRNTDAVNLRDYAHSPAHLHVAANDLAKLRRILSSLPRLSPPSSAPLSAAAAAREEQCAAALSAALDRRDVPGGETALHLAVRLGRLSAAALLLDTGADPSLQNSAGWTPFHDSILLRRPKSLSTLLLRYYRLSAIHKWRRRLPSLVAALRQVQDFYLELNFKFESSVIPPFLLARAAPSDTYRIWKRGSSARADTSLAGFDGLRISRADRSFVFLGDGADHPKRVDPGTLLVLDHGRKEVCDALEAAVGDEEEEEEMVADEAASGSVFRPGVDVTAAELVGRTNWRRKEKVELVGEWKARVFELQNVLFSLKTRKATDPVSTPVPNLELDLDNDGFLVAEMPRHSVSSASAAPRRSCYEPRERRRAEGGDIEWGFVELGEERRRRSVDVPNGQCKGWERKSTSSTSVGGGGGAGGGVGKLGKEKEMVKNLRPTVWLTEEFPLKIEEVVPLLDLFANKVKAVRRLRELLTTKFPPGTFPVKVSIPVVPTVRVVVTFTKFVPLPPAEQFFTPLSSPRQLAEEEEHQKSGYGAKATTTSWLRWSSGATSKASSRKSVSPSPQSCNGADPFAIPTDYSWVSSSLKSPKKSKSKKGSSKGT